MNHELRMKITRNLEAIKLSTDQPFSRWMFALGVAGEFVASVSFLAWAVRLMVTPALYTIGLVPLLVGVLLFAHVIQQVFRRYMNRRLRVIYEALLDSDESV
jgi:hypothetical protein